MRTPADLSAAAVAAEDVGFSDNLAAASDAAVVAAAAVDAATDAAAIAVVIVAAIYIERMSWLW